MLGKCIVTAHRSLQEQKAHCAHSCGLCKTIGRDYGIWPRLLVNTDIVLLQEMLGCIEQSFTSDFERQCLSADCFSLPRDADVPASLRYSAAITLLFAQYKLQDSVRDSSGTRRVLSQSIGFMISTEIAHARSVLTGLSFPLEHFDAQAKRAYDLERSAVQTAPHFDKLAEAHGELCGIVARHACNIVGRPDYAEAAHDFGVAFGELVYICDAFEDFDKDVERGTFNPLALLHGRRLTADARTDAASRARERLRRLYSLCKEMSGNVNTAHIARRIGLSVERLLAVEYAQPRPSAWSGVVDRGRAFRNQVRLQFSMIAEEDLTPLGGSLKRMAVLLPTAFSTLLLGCYSSPVPLTGREKIDPAMLGSWKPCASPARSDAAKIGAMQFHRLSETEYVITLPGADSAGKQEVQRMVAYPSRVADRVFLSVGTEEKDGRVNYMFFLAQLRGRTLDFRLVDDDLFRRPDNSEMLVFDSSAALTRYLAAIADDERLFDKESSATLCR